MSDLLNEVVNATPEDTERRVLDAAVKQLEVREKAKAVHAAKQAAKGVVKLIEFAADKLVAHAFPPRKALLERDQQTFLYAGQIVEFFSTRGIGKTWLLMTLALLLSAGGEVMGFSVVKRRPVLYIDGEMSRHDLQERFKQLSDRTKLPLTDYLVIVAADWQDTFLPRLDTPEGQQSIEEFVAPADVIFFDNRGCLFDAEGEKDPSAWQPAGDYLLSLRRRGKTSILGHHSNRQAPAAVAGYQDSDGRGRLPEVRRDRRTTPRDR